MQKIGAAGAIAHRPDMGSGCLQPLVDLDITVLVEFDSGLLESDSVGVCRPARSDEKIGAFENPLAILVPCVDPNLLAGTSLNPGDMRSEEHRFLRPETTQEARRQRRDLHGLRAAGRLLSHSLASRIAAWPATVRGRRS